MAMSTPMDMLRDLAEKTLNDTTVRLGKARQSHAQEISRLEQLRHYEHEYGQQLQDSLVGQGISVSTLRTYQGFLGSLNGVIQRQVKQVSVSQLAVEAALSDWKKDKQRLSAFNTLKNRADVRRLLRENRLEQKTTDEFALRTGQRKA